MKIRHQGWNEAVGAFHCDVTLDETKSDYEILFAGDVLYRQCTPFEPHAILQGPTGTAGYKFGAYFEHNGARELFTPTELASLALNGQALIPGLEIEDRQERLSERIQAAQRRAAALAKIQAQAPSHTVSTHSL